MLRIAISGVLLLVGSFTFWVWQPEVTGWQATATQSPVLSPSFPSQVLRPSEGISEAPTPSDAASGALPTVAFSPHPTVEPSVTFIALPTATPRATVRPTQQPTASDGCYSVPVTPNTPTGIAGCVRFGTGTASFYTQLGLGAAMNFCTWTLRHEKGCGSVTVTALSTGISLRVPVVDFCDCYTGTSDERIIDLQGGLLPLLGLNPAQGLWKVSVER